MLRMKSVEFNKEVKLSELDKLSPERVFQEWLSRIREYYLTPAQEIDKDQNGFASLILQLCGIDAAASFLSDESSTEKKIRNFCKQMIIRSQNFEKSRSPNANVMSEEELDEATEHLYYQYRCGLVHNGFTLQFGERYAHNNEPNHIFLISYETDSPISITGLDEDKRAFVVNPVRFRTMFQFEMQYLQKLEPQKKTAIGLKIKQSLSEEIQIAKKLG